MSQILRQLVIPNERPPSWNELWSAKHWTVRKQVADRCKGVVRGEVDPEQEFIGAPCDLVIEVAMVKPLMDVDKHPGKAIHRRAKGVVVAG